MKDMYNVVIENSVYLIIEEDYVCSCKYLGTIAKFLKKYNEKKSHKRVSLK